MKIRHHGCSEPEIVSHKLDAYEKALIDSFRQIEHVSLSRGTVGAYLTQKPDEHIISFSTTSALK